MNERYAQLFKKILTRLDLVACGVLLVILIIIGYIVLIWEKQTSIPDIEKPQAQAWDRKIPSPEYELLKSSYAEDKPPLTQDENLRTLIQTDMFSIKAVRETEESRSRFGEDIRRADQAIRAGNLDEAQRLIDTIIAADPNSREALDLKQQLENARSASTPPDG